MSMFKNIKPNELSIIANIIALDLAENRSADEINVLGNFIVAVGSLLLTIAAQQQNLQALQNNNNNNK